MAKVKIGDSGARPTDEQRRMIEDLAQRLGIDVPEPTTEAEAKFALDDLRWKERKARRVGAASVPRKD
jgi:hypothetical protein